MSKVLLQKKNTSEDFHVPVMLEEVIEILNIASDGTYVDLTLGGGGHSYEIYKEILKGKGRLISLDRDNEAIEYVRAKYNPDPGKWDLVHANFAKVVEGLTELDVKAVNGFIADLGVSSHQLDSTDRGFSYSNKAPLDMRMDKSLMVTAADLVNGLHEDELKKLFEKYGEERYSDRIARGIVKFRKEKALKTTSELVHVILKSLPSGYREGNKHPARRVFQALRIAVNSEVEELRRMLGRTFSVLQPGGRFICICFHSLEERTVADFINEQMVEDKLKLIKKVRTVPTKEEIEKNTRAKSARLLAYEKT